MRENKWKRLAMPTGQVLISWEGVRRNIDQIALELEYEATATERINGLTAHVTLLKILVKRLREEIGHV